MKWYMQEVINSIDTLDEIINEIEQIQEDVSEADSDYLALESSRKHLIKAKEMLNRLLWLIASSKAHKSGDPKAYKGYLMNSKVDYVYNFLWRSIGI